MPVELTETLWLDTHQQLSLAQLAELSTLSEAELRELVEFGVLEPVDPAAPTVVFSAEYVVTLRTVCRLRSEFELDLHATALSLRLLERIRELERQVHSLRAQQPRRFR